MSFSKTISVVAALGSIFSVGLASWKISEDIKSSQTSPLEEKINELQKQLEDAKKQPVVIEEPQSIPVPVSTPVLTQAPKPATLPPVTPPPTPPAPAETQP